MYQALGKSRPFRYTEKQLFAHKCSSLVYAICRPLNDAHNALQAHRPYYDEVVVSRYI